jgi:hypothetical protein
VKTKNQRKEVGPLRGLLIPYPLSLWSNGTHFMLVLRLENAESWKSRRRLCNSHVVTVQHFVWLSAFLMPK